MNTKRIALSLGLLLLLLAAVMVRPKKQPAPIQLPSGATMSLAKVTFGPSHEYVEGPPWNWVLSRIPLEYVPQAFHSRWPRRNYYPDDTNIMVLWEKATPAPKSGRWPFCDQQIVTDDGFEMPAYRHSFSGPIAGSVVWNYPRRASQFGVRVLSLKRGAPSELVGEFIVRNPHPSRAPTWTPEVLPARRTNETVECELLDLQVAAPGAPTNLLDRALLRLRCFEQGIPSTNWESAGASLRDPTGNTAGGAQHRGYTDGVLRVGTQPLWPDEPTWKLQVELVRNAKYLASNQWTLTVTNLSVFTNATPKFYERQIGGTAFRAAVLLPGYWEFPDGLQEENKIPQLVVLAEGRMEGSHLRLVKLTDQDGRKVEHVRSYWQSQKYWWNLVDATALTNGTVRSMIATFSWEPKHRFEFLVHPTITTNFADWPKRP